jgi:hypothetical protein
LHFVYQLYQLYHGYHEYQEYQVYYDGTEEQYFYCSDAPIPNQGQIPGLDQIRVTSESNASFFILNIEKKIILGHFAKIFWIINTIILFSTFLSPPHSAHTQCSVE